MNKKRLLKLADLLEADAKNKKGVKFDLAIWGRSYIGGLSMSCGTVACAVGLAVLSGAFKRAGLTNFHKYPETFSVCPEFDGSTGFDAVNKLFNIKIQESAFLFDAGAYPDDKHRGAVAERFVAKRIRDFVAGKVSA